MGRAAWAIAHIAAVLVGVPASFVAGAAVFANGGVSILSAERIVPVALTYLIVGAIVGFSFRLIWLKSSWWRWGVAISLPGFLIVGLMGRDIGLGYQGLYVVLLFASACSGAFIGALPAALVRRGE